MSNTTPDPTAMNKSCLNCPSLLSAQEATTFFRKGTGAPTCARYGRVMGNANSTGAQVEATAKAIAKNCPSYGESRPTVPNWNEIRFTVTLPDPEVLTNNPRTNPELVKTCNSCEHFVRQDVVASQMGWPTALCAAQGKLLLGNRLTYEASGCPDRSFGAVRTDIGSLIMLPEYAEDFRASGDPVKKFFAEKQAGFVDPIDFETEREITPDEVKRGIRAWRKIFDGNTGNHTWLPIYRLDFFDAEEQAKIPRTGDDEHPEDYVDHAGLLYKVAVLWSELDETPGLWGEPGTGKTELFRYLAWLMCMPFERISITGSTEVDDLAGKMLYEAGKGTYFQYGRLVGAWTKPCVVVVDEPNVAQDPSVWHFLRPMFDNSKQLVIDQNAGEKKDRHNDCYIGVAMNPAWDPRNAGTHVLADADVNRLMHMHVDLPPAELEREIIKARCKHDGYDIPKPILDSIMGIADDLRRMCAEDQLPVTWAIRPQLKVARLSRWFDLISAYRMASADFLDPKQQQTLLDVVRSHTAA